MQLNALGVNAPHQVGLLSTRSHGKDGEGNAAQLGDPF